MPNSNAHGILVYLGSIYGRSAHGQVMGERHNAERLFFSIYRVDGGTRMVRQILRVRTFTDVVSNLSSTTDINAPFTVEPGDCLGLCWLRGALPERAEPTIKALAENCGGEVGPSRYSMFLEFCDYEELMPDGNSPAELVSDGSTENGTCIFKVDENGSTSQLRSEYGTDDKLSLFRCTNQAGGDQLIARFQIPG